MGTTLIFVDLVVCDGWRNLSGLIGLVLAGKLSREIAPPAFNGKDRTLNRHRWDGRVYQGV